MNRMIKATVASLGLGFTLVAAVAQTPVDTAIDEGVRRESFKVELHKNLADAQLAEKKGDNFEAAKLYTDCVVLTKKIGSDVDQEQKAVVTGVVHVRLVLAEQAQRNGDYAGADVHARAILLADPKNELAIRFRGENEEAKRRMNGRMPDEATLAKLPEANAIKIQANTYAQNGKLLFEAGRLEDAETNLVHATALDPANKAAFYYLDLIRDQRHKQEMFAREDKSKQWMLEVDRAWRGDSGKREALPQPNSYARTNLIYTSNSRQSLYAKLDRIHLDQFQADGLPLGEVIKLLNDEARKR